MSLSSLSSLIGSLATIYKNIQENEDVNKNKSVSLPFTIVKNNYNKLRGLPDNLFPPLLTVMGNLSQNKHRLGLSFVFLDSTSPEGQQLF